MKITLALMAITGGIVWAYVGVRIVATIVDVIQRWWTDDWEVDDSELSSREASED